MADLLGLHGMFARRCLQGGIYAAFISSCYNAVKKKGNVKRKGRVGEFTDVIAATSSLPGQYSDVFVVCMHQTCPAVPSQAAAAWAETPGVA